MATKSKKVVESASSGFFAGKTVALTGTFATMKRAEAEALLGTVGAKVTGSVSAKTQLLVYGEGAGSKLALAKSLGVATMTELEMVEKLREGSSGAPALDDAEAKLAAQKAAAESKLGPAREALDAERARQTAKWGMTLGALLTRWLETFAKRPDVHVSTNKEGRPLAPAALARLATSLAPPALSLASELGTREFTWVFQDCKETAGNSSPGYNGGRLNLTGFEGFSWWPKPESNDYEHHEADAMFDEIVAEGVGMLSYDPGEGPLDALVVFVDANDCERFPMGTVTDYLTEGARRAFVWYWPKKDYWEANDFVEKLRKNSLPRSTPADALRAALQARGLTEPEANAMHRWLGADAVLLVPT